jgi:hypothetical protein
MQSSKLHTGLRLQSISTISADNKAILELQISAWESYLDSDWSLFSWYANLYISGADSAIKSIRAGSSYNTNYFSAQIDSEQQSIAGLGSTGSFFASNNSDHFIVAIATIEISTLSLGINPLNIRIAPLSANQLLANKSLETTVANKGSGIPASASGNRYNEIGTPLLQLNSLPSEPMHVEQAFIASLHVLNIRKLPCGLALALSQAPNLQTLSLYNSYNAAASTQSRPDLHLESSRGQTVDKLSLHWENSTQELYVLRTDPLTGISQGQQSSSDLLAADIYTLTIESRPDGLISAASADLLDGNGDGMSGDDFVTILNHTTAANRIIIADTARGPGQSLSVNGAATRAGLSGLPVLITSSESLRQLQGTIGFDATALNQVSLIQGRDLPSDWTLQIAQSTAGLLTYSAAGSTAISGRDLELFRFSATVAANAAYGTTSLIQATAHSDQIPSLSFTADPGLILFAYPGDSTGNGTLSSMDASYVQRVVVGLSSGFDAYPCVAPLLIGDTSGNGTLSSLDAAYIQRRVVELDAPTFPSPPAAAMLG